MKQVLENPIMVNVELALVQDLVKIVEAAMHSEFKLRDINSVMKTLISKAEDAIRAQQEAQQETSEVVSSKKQK